MTEKQCSKCLVWKPIEAFRKQPDRKNGSSHCKYCRSVYGRAYDATRRDKKKRSLAARLRYRENPKRSVEYSRDWRRRNPEKQYQQGVKRNARKKLNLNVRLIENLRARIREAMKFGWKSAKTRELLGCSIPNFKIYLESRFKVGMTWSNYGRKGWHIDHIAPCALFDLTKPEHQRICFHFSNMRPMWWRENVSRGVKGHHQFILPL